MSLNEVKRLSGLPCLRTLTLHGLPIYSNLLHAKLLYFFCKLLRETSFSVCLNGLKFVCQCVYRPKDGFTHAIVRIKKNIFFVIELLYSLGMGKSRERVKVKRQSKSGQEN